MPSENQIKPDPKALSFDFLITPSESGLRADQALSQLLPEAWSRTQIKQNCLKLTIDDQPARLSDRLPSGSRLKIALKPLLDREKPQAEKIALEIVFEDQALIVIKKPWGMTVHPAPGQISGTLVNALLAHTRELAQINSPRPGIVHRLDKETSGLIVCAKTDQAHLALTQAFKNREVKKTYLALVQGRLSPRQGLIEAPLGRDPKKRFKQAVVEGGREAQTGYRVLEEGIKHSLVELDLITGRTHQLRVHLASLGCPIVGDSLYGRRDQLSEKLCLVAIGLSLRHPINGQELSWEVGLPDYFENALKEFRINNDLIST